MKGTRESSTFLAELDPSLSARLLALDEPAVLPNWAEVLDRARRPPSRSRNKARLLLGAACATVAFVAAAPAFGLHLDSVLPFLGSPAAPSVEKHTFETYNLGAPPELDPGAIASDARRITSLQLAGDAHVLYVAPTANGGFCYDWSDLAGGCDEFGTIPVNVSWTSGKGHAAVVGTISSRYVANVKVELSDGSEVTPDVTWISRPINAGFFAYAPAPGTNAVAVSGYDSTGALVARETMGDTHPGSAPPEFARLAQRTVAKTVTTPDGQAIAYTAPSHTGGLCAWVTLSGANLNVFGFDGCLPHDYTPQGISYRLVHVDSSYLLLGSSSPRFTQLRITSSDGRAVTVEPTKDGIILGSVPESADMGHLLLSAYDAQGALIFAHPLAVSPG